MTGTMNIDGRELVPIGTGHARNVYICISREVTYRLVPIKAGTGYNCVASAMAGGGTSRPSQKRSPTSRYWSASRMGCPRRKEAPLFGGDWLNGSGTVWR